MKHQLYICLIYVCCMTVCSMEKIKSDPDGHVKSKYTESKTDNLKAKTTDTNTKIDTKELIEAIDKIETKSDNSKENVKSKEKQETRKITEEKEVLNKKKQFLRKTFPTKEDIPKDYLEYLLVKYNIKEDPVGDYERELAEYYDEFDGEDDLDLGYNYGKDPLYNNYYDETYTDYGVTQSENDTDINGTETTCKGCKVREEDKNLRLASIKSTILDKIGFSMNNLPNMTGKTIPKIPSLQKLIQQHEMLADAPYQDEDDYLPEDEYFGQVKRAYTISQKPPDEFDINVSGGCYFELPESVSSRKIQDATLWIYLDPSAFERKSVVEIYIYVIPQKAKPQYILKGPTRYKKTSSPGWLEFKFAHIAHHWVKQPDANRGIVIQALDEDGKNYIITPGAQSDESLIPMLEMYTIEYRDRHHRQKRSVQPHVCTEQDGIETCCRYPLRVDFVEFGWDWVIAPTGYMANYCSGECRYRHMDNNPQAYLIQQTPNGNGPCCTASKYFPLAMLYFDHAHTVLYTYMQKMIVERCGCA